MANKLEKPELKIPIILGNYYWVKPFQNNEFQPARCEDPYRTGNLCFCFTNGMRMQVGNVWEVEPLNYK